jgi:uncharacterized protein YuzE
MTMTSNQRVVVELDEASGLAYVRFSDGEVVRTVALTDAINVDLDEYGVAVGIEVLDLDTEMPFQRFITEYHVPSAHVEVLRLMRPTLTRFVYQVRSGAGTAVTQPAGVATLS